MKKILSLIICLCLTFPFLECFATTPISVELDGNSIEFPVAPIIKNDRTLVPLRAIFEAMGATVKWDSVTGNVTSVLEDTTITIMKDIPTMTVNSKTVSLDVAPCIVGESTMVPTRAIAEGFGCYVNWDNDNRKVVIYSKAFLDRINSAEELSSLKKLSDGNVTTVSAFVISLLDGYDVKSQAPDGTDFEINHITDTARASLSVRADIYNGEDIDLTYEYAKEVAEDLVSIASGTYVSSEIVTINDTQFMKIRYTAKRVVYGLSDNESDNTVYITRKDGITYTMTYWSFGEVSKAVAGDFNYMINSLVVA